MPTRWDRVVLHEVVWLQPMGHLSRCFRETSATIRAECRRLNIPMPTMSYWAAIQAGTFPLRTPLPDDGTPPGEGYVLLAEEVAQLTGRTDTLLQRARLQELQIPFAVNLHGEPLVPVTAAAGEEARGAAEVAKLNSRLKAMYKLIGIKRVSL